MTQLSVVQHAELERVIAALPAEKIQQVIDLANELQETKSDEPKRGSAEAILAGLNDVGPFQFEEGELDQILKDL